MPMLKHTKGSSVPPFLFFMDLSFWFQQDNAQIDAFSPSTSSKCDLQSCTERKAPPCATPVLVLKQSQCHPEHVGYIGIFKFLKNSKFHVLLLQLYLQSCASVLLFAPSVFCLVSLNALVPCCYYH